MSDTTTDSDSGATGAPLPTQFGTPRASSPALTAIRAQREGNSDAPHLTRRALWWFALAILPLLAVAACIYFTAH